MVVDIGRQALWATLLVSAPLLGVALVVGLVIGIVQAATSINEMTLSFIPKVIAMGLAILLFGSWMLGTLVEFTRAIFQRIPALFG
jgi:flagellar biosynthetic protein FliQ